ncbi:MFS transporter [Dermatophilus congolensis]|nr:MFS transporter [Dermatophilus congolensis]MBO3151852.1 MFS transporter [Dermatophilus congolensis]MBO3161144.1 MFS transporter [Dermatophilus congolensis]MBO3163135.1 MFS transporter [Dermatophilus congolensis]MBO3176690.1 MFS transporter [Dermatophilus congolensis]
MKRTSTVDPSSSSPSSPATHSRWRPESVRTGPSSDDVGLFGQPRGLPWMLQVEMWERFSWFGMRAILLYFITDTFANGGLGLDKNTGQVVMATYQASVLFLTIPGGIFADRVIGPWRSTLYGGVVIMLGQLLLVVPIPLTSWIGLFLIAFGTGFIKPNLSTMVGGLYDEKDPRREAGFQLFYMSINVGSLISPLITSFLKNHYGYHVGFMAAGIGMAFGLVAFVYGRGKLSQFAFDVPTPLKPGEGKKLALYTVLFLATVLLLTWLYTPIFGGLAQGIAYVVFTVAVAASAFYFITMFRSPQVTPHEREHLWAFLPLWVGSMLFTMIFEQASGKMASFAKDNTDGVIAGSFGLSAEAYQSINPAAVLILAPILGWVFTRRAGKFPTTAMKFAIALAIIGFSALMMGWGFDKFPGGANLAPWWFLGLVFLVQTVAELFMNPVGLAATTSLAPKQYASQTMTLWLLAAAAGQGTAAVVIDQTRDLGDVTFYYGLGIVTIIVAVAMALLSPWTQSKMSDIGTGSNPAE